MISPVTNPTTKENPTSAKIDEGVHSEIQAEENLIEEDRPLADPSLLVDRVPAHLQSSPVAAMWVVLIGIVFLVLSYLPIWHTSIWGHVAYGEQLWEAKTVSTAQSLLPLTTTEPLLPLAEGVPYIETSWLSNLAMFGMNAKFGFAGLQFLYALSMTICLVLITRFVYKKTESHLWSFLAMASFLTVGWLAASLGIARPELAGLVCFTFLVSSLFTQRWSLWRWAGLVAMFALWANLHVSWVVGLAAIAICLVGQAIEVWYRSGNLWGAITNQSAVRNFMLLELAAVAVLINPYGLGIYFEAAAIIQNTNHVDLSLYDPITLRSMGGMFTLGMVVLMLVVYKWTPRRVFLSEFLLVTGFLVAAMWSQHLLIWWCPVAAMFFALHGAAIWKRREKRLAILNNEQPDSEKEASIRSGKWSVVALGLAWIFFAYTPFGATLLHGQAKTLDERNERLHKALVELTPIDAVAYLNEHPQPGLIFNAYEYGDYMLHASQPKPNLFVASNIQNVPTEIWKDYLRISRLGSDWEDKLDRYSVNTVFIDQASRSQMIRRLKESSIWKLEYEDNIAAIFIRRRPIRSPIPKSVSEAAPLPPSK